jgi:amino acid transporter
MSDKKLLRGIGRWSLTAIVINTVIGAGIFGLPSKVAKLVGSYSILAFIVCSIIIAFVVLCFAEVSSRFRNTGGAYTYTKEAYGEAAGFQVGWLFWITRFTAFAANCNLLVSYLGFFDERLATGPLRILIISLVVFGLTSITLIGIKGSVWSTNILTVAKFNSRFDICICRVRICGHSCRRNEGSEKKRAICPLNGDRHYRGVLYTHPDRFYWNFA